MSVTELRDSGWNHYKRSLRDLAQHSIQVGIVDNPELAQIAAWLEFGTPDAKHPIPERPAHRICFEKNKAELKRKYAHYTKLIGEGKISQAQALQQIGDWYAGKLRWEIINYNAVPNSEATIKHKGVNDPLMDTGEYVNAIKPDVRRRVYGG